MKVTQFKNEAQKQGISIETVRSTFENDLDKGLILGIIASNKIEALIAEMTSGKISLANLSGQLNLTIYQVRVVLQHLLKTKRIKGELTYSSFTSKITLKKTLLEKAKAHKRNHILKLRNRKPKS